VISPVLANIYLHYVYDLWVRQWRKRYAEGDVIVVRYADDLRQEPYAVVLPVRICAGASGNRCPYRERCFLQTGRKQRAHEAIGTIRFTSTSEITNPDNVLFQATRVPVYSGMTLLSGKLVNSL
jgi:hypothetical protein